MRLFSLIAVLLVIGLIAVANERYALMAAAFMIGVLWPVRDAA